MQPTRMKKDIINVHVFHWEQSFAFTHTPIIAGSVWDSPSNEEDQLAVK